MKYNIITFSAERIVAQGRMEQIDRTYRMTYKLDLTKNGFGRNAILAEEKHDDNALFYQANVCKNDGVYLDSEQDEETLRESLIFLNFSSIFKGTFSGNLAEKCRSLRESKDSGFISQRSKKEMEGENAQAYRLYDLLDPRIGVDISFDGKTYKKFIPFDKSNSMARDYRISFIDAGLKKKLDKRLLLDIDFSEIELNPSKYFSYRGLYMSSGRRIDLVDKIDFNEETVIVLKDKKYTKHNVNLFRNRDIIVDGGSNKLVEFELADNADMEGINVFDGEGLISPLYAGFINEVLRTKYNQVEDAHSFQIRMPFTKGVLHEVDYDRFLSEEAGEDADSIMIKDYFGIKRDLRKARIILTESMFKCAKWLRYYQQKHPDEIGDPMAYFFDRNKKYDHALYITRTDIGLAKRNVFMNYQFFSTLALTEEELESLVADQIEKISIIRNREFKNWDGIGEDPDDEDTLVDDGSESDLGESDNGEPEIEQGNEEGMNDGIESEPGSEQSEDDYTEAGYAQVKEKCFAAVKKNRAFLEDVKVKGILNLIERDYEVNIGLAKIEVEGDQRFLSCDLLAFLIEILKQTDYDKNVEKLKRKTIRTGSFYMPKKYVNFQEDAYYGILRNPHLSRNEQCILRCMSKEKGIYKKYFSQLTGICMVSFDSEVPAALSGADFDGDLVKIVADQRIVNAMIRGGYQQGEKRYERKLPVVSIVPVKSENNDIATPDGVPFLTLIDTFSNNVGIISNLAVRYAKEEYSEEADEAFQNKCAECTIVTGLEIDAAKTGFHPTGNIEILRQGLEKKGKKDKGAFLKNKEKIVGIKKWKNVNPKIEVQDNKAVLLKSLKSSEKWLEDVPMDFQAEETKLIDRFPGYYCSYLMEKAKMAQKDVKSKSDQAALQCFKFEEEGWKKNLNQKYKDAVECVVLAYTEIKRLQTQYNQSRKWNEKQSFMGYVITRLQMKYDVYGDDAYIMGRYQTAYSEIECCIDSLESVEAAIDRLVQCKWHFTENDQVEETLKYILDIQDDSRLSDVTIAFLADFDQQGYMLLYYILCDIRRDRSLLLNPREYYEAESEKVQSNTDDENGDGRMSKREKMLKGTEKYREYFDKLSEDYFRMADKKMKNSDIEDNRVAMCRGFLNECFKDCSDAFEESPEGSFDEALKVVWAMGKDYDKRNFVWSVFTKAEILSKVKEENEGKEYVG